MACFIPIKQFKLTTTADSVPTTALAIDPGTLFPKTVQGNNMRLQARVYAKTAAAVVKFGASGVAASNTVASNAFADGNFLQPAGSIDIYDLYPGQDFVSAVTEDGATAGNVYVTIGYGEARVRT